MLILPNSCFIHVPKTGGSWVRKVIITSGIAFEEYSVNGNCHIGYKDCPYPDKFRFGFVRHPVSICRSYWQFKMGAGWDSNNQMDIDCQSDNFHEFIRNVLAKYPGLYGRSLTELLGKGETEIEYIGKYENLVEDLIEALTRAGETFDEGAIRDFPPVNVSDKKRFPAELSAGLEAKVIEAEMEVIRRFGYGLQATR